MNKFDTVSEAFGEASLTLKIIDTLATKLAKMLVGRLRKTDSYYCAQLKKELTEFNARTYTWKS